MKRTIAFILAALMIFTFAACKNTSDSNSNNTPSDQAYADALAVLEAVWAAYPEDDKFPVFGGSTDVSMEYDGKPGPFTITMTDALSNTLHVPEEIMPQIKAAASMIHMMNANTFTSAVFEVEGDMEAFSTTLVDNINNTQWVCGFPETVITVQVGGYLLMAFGSDEIVQTFETTALSKIDGAVLVHEGPVSSGDDEVGIVTPEG